MRRSASLLARPKLTASEKHRNLVGRYAQAYAGVPKDILRVMIKELRQELTVAAREDKLNKDLAKLHAAEYELGIPYRVIWAIGVYPSKAIKVSKNDAYDGPIRTILICPRDEANSEAAHNADHVILVDDINDPQEGITKLNEFRKLFSPLSRFIITPGWGSLSEDPRLPAACEEHGYLFAGPNAKAMALAGRKLEAKKIAEKCGVPTIPYITIPADGISMADLSAFLDKVETNIGFPLMLKEDESGGGMGNKKIKDRTELQATLRDKQLIKSIDPNGHPIKTEKKPKLFYLEQFIKGPFNHIEVQGFYDDEGFVIFSTRDCSIQVRDAKIDEIAPAMHEKTSQVIEYAKLMMKELHASGYRAACTNEFVIDVNGNIYHLENNPRLQVEHTTTEIIHDDIDFIGLICSIANRGFISAYIDRILDRRGIDALHLTTQQKVEMLSRLSKHKVAIEVRLEAIEYEELGNNQLRKIPFKGTAYIVHADPRIYLGIRSGSEVNSIKYNALIGLVLGCGNTHEEALKDIEEQLLTLHIEGIPTNKDRLLSYVRQLRIDKLAVNSETINTLNKHYIPEDKCAEAAKKSFALASLFAHQPDLTERSSQSLLPVWREPKPGRSGHHD